MDPAAPIAPLSPSQRRFARFSFGVILLNLAVIVWGAYVRASGSGAGCGDHWPDCNGEIIPRAPEIATIIEFTHRLTSGLALLATVALLIWAFRAWPRGSLVRWGAVAAMLFMILEAGVGAGIVLLKMVGRDDSMGRAAIMAIHLMNTFLLLGSYVFTSFWATGRTGTSFRHNRLAAVSLGLAALGLLLLGASGAVTALGDTLFPAGTLMEGLKADLSPTAHLLVRLRIFHPMIAVLVGGGASIAVILAALSDPPPALKRAAVLFVSLFGLQLALGTLNVALLAPVWTQLCHLLLADGVWMALIWVAAEALSPARPTPQPHASSEYAPASR